MTPKRDIKKAAKEQAKQKRAEKESKRAEEKRADHGRQENIAKNRREKGVSIKETPVAPKKSSEAETGDAYGKKKQMIEDTSNFVAWKPPTSTQPLPSSEKEAPRALMLPPLPPPPKGISTSGEGSSSQAPPQIAPSESHSRDSIPWSPKILIPSLKLPEGRPLSIRDSALNFPEYFLKAIIPPRDVHNTMKNKIKDLQSSLMKSLLSTTFQSMKLIARSHDLHEKVGRNGVLLQELKSKVDRMEKEKAELKKKLDSAQQDSTGAAEMTEASKKKTDATLARLASKDEELLEKIKLLGEANRGVKQVGSARAWHVRRWHGTPLAR